MTTVQEVLDSEVQVTLKVDTLIDLLVATTLIAQDRDYSPLNRQRFGDVGDLLEAELKRIGVFR